VTKRVVGVLVLVFVVVPAVYVLEEAVRTLSTLDGVERERDSWQRPDEIMRQLDLHPGLTVVDLGSGAGYFALKIAPRVAPNGRVLAVDLRRQSLAFLWIRAMLGGHWNIHAIRGRVDDPNLPLAPIDVVLIANTYHELAAPEQILKTLYASLRPGGRLVVVDRGPRAGSETRAAAQGHHEMTRAVAERQINHQGFQTVLRDDTFIDRSGDEDLWWLVVFRKT
jgi:predicted methyltransferase